MVFDISLAYTYLNIFRELLAEVFLVFQRKDLFPQTLLLKCKLSNLFQIEKLKVLCHSPFSTENAYSISFEYINEHKKQREVIEITRNLIIVCFIFFREYLKYLCS